MAEKLKKEEEFANKEVDWDDAEKHRLANMAYKVNKIDMDSKDIEKCLCCQQPIPSEEHWFSMCDSNVEFNELGAPGFALLFEFNFYSCCLFFLLTLVYFLPMVVFWGNAYMSIADVTDLLEEFSEIGLFSIGILTYDPVTEEGIRYFDSGDQAKMLDYIGLLITISLAVLFIALLCIRRRLQALAVELDKTTYTQSDFAVIGRLMEFNDYS